MLQSKQRTPEEIDAYLEELKTWLKEDRDTPAEEMTDFFSKRLGIYEDVHLGHWPEEYAHIADFFRDGLNSLLDIGCGTGGQTVTIARNRDCTITAVDLLPELLEEFRARIKKAGLENRVTAIQGSMDALPFSPGEFDVIWAEGSIYNIGFERGLREWRQYLKPGGIIAVTECSWLSGARLASKFISDYFPDIDSPSGKVRILEEAGYAPLAHFALPEHCWTENYFAHASARIPGFLEQYGYSEKALLLAEMQKNEIAHYEKYKAYYGYVFYIGQKPEE